MIGSDWTKIDFKTTKSLDEIVEVVQLSGFIPKAKVRIKKGQLYLVNKGYTELWIIEARDMGEFRLGSVRTPSYDAEAKILAKQIEK